MTRRACPPVRQGFILPAALALTVFMILIGGFLLTFVVAEQRIARSQSESVKNYYLAEAGAKEAMWKLENDPAWRDPFITNPGGAWTAEFDRVSPLFPNGSYHVSITNSDHARGDIVSTGTVTLPDGGTSRRVIRSSVFKASGIPNTQNNAILTDGNNINVISSTVTIGGAGSIFANNNINVDWWGDLIVADTSRAVMNINVLHGSTLTTALRYDQNEPPAPTPLDIPTLDFDSVEPDSFKNRADATYTENAFAFLMWNNPNLVLNGIIYVEGKVRVRGNTRLTVNGVLVADDTVEVGESFIWCRTIFNCRSGNSSLTVNRTPGEPSGVLTKKKFTAGIFANNITISGLVYALDQVRLTSFSRNFLITGGVFAQQFDATSLTGTMTINLDSDTITETVGEFTYAPVVSIEHWEEEY